MKNKFLAFLGLTSLLFIACDDTITDDNNDTVEETTSAIFAGQIENPLAENVRLDFNGEKIEVALDENNQFQFDLENASYSYYHFKNGSQMGKVYLGENDSVYVNLDAEDFDNSQVFSGDLVEVNTANIQLSLVNWDTDYPAFFSLDETDFLTKLDTIQFDLNNSYSDIALSDEDKNTMQNRANYLVLSHQLNYASYHEYYAKEEAVISENYYDFITDVAIENESMLDLEEYQDFVAAHFSYLTKGVDDVAEKLAVLNASYESRAIKETLFEDNFRYDLIGLSEKDLTLVEQFMSENIEDSSMLNDFIEMIVTAYNVAEGKPSVAIVGKDIKGIDVSVVGKGKITYIDCWASWCGPCKRELPYFVELEEEYGEQIDFVKLSMDDDYDAWFSYMEEQDLIGKGTNLISNADFDSEFAVAYGIKAIPRFILLDADGKIISANASRPSENISEQFDALLN